MATEKEIVAADKSRAAVNEAALCELLDRYVAELEERRKAHPGSFRPGDKQATAGHSLIETEALKARLRGYLARVEALN